MAMTIMNNLSAMMALGELNKNNSTLDKQLKKVSSGMRINSAGDDASGYAISEKMRTRLRSLDQDIRNTQTGGSMLRVAEGGVQSIIDELRTIKELALNAANDHNTDLDRATIQKEVDNRLANIDDIAVETNYNGKRLLDGSIRSPRKTMDLTPPEKPTERFTPARQLGGTLTIDKDGFYDLLNTCPTEVNITAQNVVLYGLNAVCSIVCQSPNTNLWLQSVDLFGDYDKSLITFSGGNNTLTFSSRNMLRRYTHTYNTIDYALINVGGGLSIFSETEESNLVLSDESQVSGGIPPAMKEVNAPLIGLDVGDKNSKANLNIINGHIELREHARQLSDGGIVLRDNGTSMNADLIGAGVNGSFGDIYILGGDVKVSRSEYEITTEENTFDGRNLHYGEVEQIPRNYSRSNQLIYHGAPLPAEPFHGLRIHTGTRANENLAVTIESMKTEDIGVSDLKVVTQKKATEALDVIDSAIDYVLDQATHIGAYISRLEFTESNLTTASESTQSSESTIRDADMAKEMTEYTKANVLAQAAQSMLAQANQSSSGVISLLQ